VYVWLIDLENGVCQWCILFDSGFTVMLHPGEDNSTLSFFFAVRCCSGVRVRFDQ